MYPLYRRNSNLRVDLGSLDVSMAENLLNHSDVGSVLVHQRCHRVTEQVTRTEFTEICVPDVLANNPRQLVAADLSSLC